MRTLLLAGLAAFTLATGAGAQSSGGAPAGAGLAAMPEEAAPMEVGLLAQAAPQALNRVYTLPPEADVEVTGSVDARSCVGDTVGQRLCPDEAR
jgi:hypothetical protein